MAHGRRPSTDFDTVLRAGSVIDGSGRPSRTADISVRNGRVVSIGTVDGSASSEIDADGLVVCPGVIDIHTHHDAQLFWDRAATPSSLHGVTTVIGGNCGFSVAPLVPGQSHGSFEPGADDLYRPGGRLSPAGPPSSKVLTQ